MKLYINPIHPLAENYYANHGHFHKGDAGLDLYVLENMVFHPDDTLKIKFGITCEPDDGKAYYLFPRSSISKTPLRMANSIGLIDGGYRGEIMAVCDNIKNEEYHLKEGQRLFQLVAADSSPIEFELREKLTETSRGDGGFGSTGT